MLPEIRVTNNHGDTLTIAMTRPHKNKVTWLFSRGRDMFGNRLTLRLPRMQDMPKEMLDTKDKTTVKVFELQDRDSGHLYSINYDAFKAAVIKFYKDNKATSNAERGVNEIKIHTKDEAFDFKKIN